MVSPRCPTSALTELYENPKTINQSTTRTLAHTVDFLAQLAAELHVHAPGEQAGNRHERAEQSPPDAGSRRIRASILRRALFEE